MENKVYLCYIVPTKPSKQQYLLGAYTSRERAEKAALTEVKKPDAAWWTQYRIQALNLDNDVVAPCCSPSGGA